MTLILNCDCGKVIGNPENYLIYFPNCSKFKRSIKI